MSLRILIASTFFNLTLLILAIVCDKWVEQQFKELNAGNREKANK